MSDVGWRVLENIFWGTMALSLFWGLDSWWKLLGLVPLAFCNMRVG